MRPFSLRSRYETTFAVAVYLRRREKELDEYERLLFGEDTAASAEEEPAEAEDEAAEEAAPAEDTAE